MIQLFLSALPEFFALLPMLFLVLLPLAVLIPLSCSFFSMTRIRRASQALSRQCDPEPLLKLSQQTIRRYGKSRNPRHRNPLFFARVNAATALYNLGQYEQALKHLAVPQLESYPLPSQAVCLLNRAAVFFDQGRAQDMANALDRAEALLADPAFPAGQRPMFRSILSTDRLAFRLLTEGPGPEVEAAYRDLLAQTPADGESQRVGFHLQLARCALAREDREEARRHLEYAVEHGNRLKARNMAEEMLETLTK